jgi:hypothetical protein
MTIQLPNDLSIASFVSVKIVQTTPVNQRGTLTGDGVEMPINWIAKTQILKTKQSESPFANLISSIDHVSRKTFPPFSQRTRGLLAVKKAP